MLLGDFRFAKSPQAQNTSELQIFKILVRAFNANNDCLGSSRKRCLPYRHDEMHRIRQNFFGKQNKKRAYGRLRFPKPRSAETFRSTAISFEGCLAPEKAALRALLPAFFLRQIRREFAAHRILHFRLQLFNALGALEFFLRILLGFLGEFMRSDVAARECVRHGAC